MNAYPQQQQQQPQQLQQQQQVLPPQPSPPLPSQQEAASQPGFFGRLFRRKPATGADAAQHATGTDAHAVGGTGGAPHAQPPHAGEPQQPPIVDGPNHAGCCAKPWTATDQENAERLRAAPLSPSRFACLRDPAAPPVPGNGNGGPAWSPGAPPAAKPAGATTTPQVGPPPDTQVLGPFLRFGGYDPQTHSYYASVLIVVHQSKGVKEPVLKFRDVNVPRSEASAPAKHLDHYRGFNFWRFDLTILCGVPERCVEYCVVLASDHAFTYQNRHSFFVPGVDQKWRWGFYSCNGFDNPKYEHQLGGIQPLWRDVLHCHEERPLHVMLGGGDQIYNDGVWNVPALVAWLQVPDRQQRLAAGWTQEMADQVEWFYFTNYFRHWSEPLFSDAMTTVPQVMTWDDHDIFDGWGNYPPELQNCAVFRGVFFMARRFFCLFQQHSTPELVKQHNSVFGEFGLNWLGCLGATTAVLMLDSRSERSRDAILTSGSWSLIQQQLASLPASVRHVAVVASVPLVYPQIPIVEASLGFLTGKGRMASSVVALMQKSGLSSLLTSVFDEVEVLDDLTDHWSSRAHEAEKVAVLQMLQDISRARNLRFTFLSGGVHVGGVGRFCSQPKVNLRFDHRFMPQIISSAIGNRPPAAAVVKALTANARQSMLDHATKECMLKMFPDHKMLMASRNWCLVEERPLVPGAPGCDGSLALQLRVEKPQGIGQRPETFDITVPSLEGLPGAFSAAVLRPYAGALPRMPMPAASWQQRQEWELQQQGQQQQQGQPVGQGGAAQAETQAEAGQASEPQGRVDVHQGAVGQGAGLHGVGQLQGAGAGPQQAVQQQAGGQGAPGQQGVGLEGLPGGGAQGTSVQQAEAQSAGYLGGQQQDGEGWQGGGYAGQTVGQQQQGAGDASRQPGPVAGQQQPGPAVGQQQQQQQQQGFITGHSEAGQQLQGPVAGLSGGQQQLGMQQGGASDAFRRAQDVGGGPAGQQGAEAQRGSGGASDTGHSGHQWGQPGGLHEGERQPSGAESAGRAGAATEDVDGQAGGNRQGPQTGGGGVAGGGLGKLAPLAPLGGKLAPLSGPAGGGPVRLPAL